MIKKIEVKMDKCETVSSDEILYTKNMSDCSTLIAITQDGIRALWHVGGSDVNNDKSTKKCFEVVGKKAIRFIVVFGTLGKNSFQLTENFGDYLEKLNSKAKITWYKEGNQHVSLWADGSVSFRPPHRPPPPVPKKGEK